VRVFLGERSTQPLQRIMLLCDQAMYVVALIDSQTRGKKASVAAQVPLVGLNHPDPLIVHGVLFSSFR
jgi:hypothetical protein